jgi:hypothetical protein
MQRKFYTYKIRVNRMDSDAISRATEMGGNNCESCVVTLNTSQSLSKGVGRSFLLV